MQSPEPIYDYQPGKGWVVTPVNLTTLDCGTIVRWEKRYPEPGERCVRAVKGDVDYLDANAEFNLEMFIKYWTAGHTIHDFSMYTDEDIEYWKERGLWESRDWVWVVVTPVGHE